MRTREISNKATADNSNDYAVELGAKWEGVKAGRSVTLTLTVAAIDIQDVLDTLAQRGYKNPTSIKKI